MTPQFRTYAEMVAEANYSATEGTYAVMAGVLQGELDRARARLNTAFAALEEIARRPSVERNPDGDDQAAETMQMIAREALGTDA